MKKDNTNNTMTESSYELQLTNGQLRYLSDCNQTVNRMFCLSSLIDRASLLTGKYTRKGFETTLTIGQAVISEVELAEIWQCNRKTVSKLIDRFNELGLISSKQGNRTSVHTIHCVSRWLVDGKVIDNPNALIPDEFIANRYRPDNIDNQDPYG